MLLGLGLSYDIGVVVPLFWDLLVFPCSYLWCATLYPVCYDTNVAVLLGWPGASWGCCTPGTPDIR
jgi:hypothetical protein